MMKNIHICRCLAAVSVENSPASKASQVNCRQVSLLINLIILGVTIKNQSIAE